MLDKLLGVASALAYAAGTVAAPAGPDASVVLTFEDPNIVESSGLVATGELFVTTNDSGDGGRVFVVDRSGATVGTTSWEPGPTDAEALAPAGDGVVWVGDTGDNARSRESVTVLKVPYGRTDRMVTPTSYELVYPDRPHDAETLLADPRTGQLFVVTKDVFGGTVYAAPERLSGSRPNRLTEVGHGPSVATDGSFFPDGRHYVVRGYARATVYTFPGFEAVGSFRLPQQRQGEGIAVGADDELYLTTEGQFTHLVSTRLPTDIAAAMAPAPSEQAAEQVAAEPDEDEGASWWPWLAGIAAFVGVGGWLLFRRGAPS
jgi:hypothetical protein